MATNSWLRLFALAALVVAMAAPGCGFRFRQSASLPEVMSSTVLEVRDPRGQFRRELRTALQSNGVDVSLEKMDGAAVLSIPVQSLRREVLSVGARARAREFELVYQVRFSLRGPEGEEIVPPQDLELRREYTFDEQQVLGTTGEEEILRQDLRRDMVRLILLRLESFGGRER